MENADDWGWSAVFNTLNCGDDGQWDKKVCYEVEYCGDSRRG